MFFKKSSFCKMHVFESVWIKGRFVWKRMNNKIKSFTHSYRESYKFVHERHSCFEFICDFILLESINYFIVNSFICGPLVKLSFDRYSNNKDIYQCVYRIRLYSRLWIWSFVCTYFVYLPTIQFAFVFHLWNNISFRRISHHWL